MRLPIQTIAKRTLFLFLFVPSLVFSQTDVEKFFTANNTADLSGTYPATGIAKDSSAYSGTVKLEKWNTFSTQRGSVLQSFKVKADYDNWHYSGIAVFDGQRLYYAIGEGNKKNFHLMMVSKLVLSNEAMTNLVNLEQKKLEAEKKHKNVQWDGKSPWYGYFGLQKETNAFGYYFDMGGEWGEYCMCDMGYPNTGDTGSYRMLHLKKNGEHDDKDVYFGVSFDEVNGLIMEENGENVNLSALTYDSDIGGNKLYYWGSGMFVTDPATTDALLVSMMGGPENTCFGWFELSNGKLVGTWTGNEGYGRGTEEWEVPADVIAKNPGLFK